MSVSQVEIRMIELRNISEIFAIVKVLVQFFFSFYRFHFRIWRTCVYLELIAVLHLDTVMIPGNGRPWIGHNSTMENQSWTIFILKIIFVIKSVSLDFLQFYVPDELLVLLRTLEPFRRLAY